MPESKRPIKKAIRINKKDNVAICLERIKKGDLVKFDDTVEVVSNETIEIGHKIAIKKIKKGDFVVKYGEVIGKATKSIKKGDHVHIHNVESLRARDQR